MNYIIAHFCRNKIFNNRQFNYISMNYLFLSISLYKYTIFSVCDNSYYKPIFARSFGSFPFWKWHSCELCDYLCEHMLPFSRVHTYQPWCTAITIEPFSLWGQAVLLYWQEPTHYHPPYLLRPAVPLSILYQTGYNPAIYDSHL